MRTLPAGVLAALILSLAGPAAASAQSEPCSARGETVVAENATARVFSVRGSGEVKRIYRGCERGQKPVELARDVSPEDDEETHTSNTLFTLSGAYVAFFSTSSSDFGAGEFGTGVTVQSVARGSRPYEEDLAEREALALVVRDDGAAAWMTDASGGYTEIDARAPGANASTTLAFARGIDRASLAIDAGGVHWVQDGTPRSAQPQPGGGAAPSGTAVPGPQTLDPRFGQCGFISPPVTRRRGIGGTELAAAPDGSVFLGGHATFGSESGFVYLSRLRPDRTLDTSFGTNGAASIRVPGAGSNHVFTLTGLAVQPDGKIVAAGSIRDDLSERAVLARFRPDGTPDASFGQGGFVTDALPATSSALYDVTIATDGAIVATGLRNDGSGEFVDRNADRIVVARYRDDSSLDPGFGDGGIASFDLGTGRSQGNVVRPSGSGLIVGGEAGQQFALLRLTASGALDGSFGDGGKTLDSPPGAGGIDALDVGDGGSVVAVGGMTNVRDRDVVALARYGADGRLDRAFGSGGFAVDRFGYEPKAIVAGPDGALTVAGGANYDAGGGAGLLRYRPDGSRDAAFGMQGGLVSSASYGTDVNDLIAEPDGTILGASEYGSEFNVARWAVADPALAAVAGGPRVCTGAVATKSLSQLLRRGKTAKYGKLRVGFTRNQPGGVRLSAVVRVGSRQATLGRATDGSPAAGTDVSELKVSSRAYRLLRRARKATITVTLTGTEGGAATVATRTLKR